MANNIKTQIKCNNILFQRNVIQVSLILSITGDERSCSLEGNSDSDRWGTCQITPQATSGSYQWVLRSGRVLDGPAVDHTYQLSRQAKGESNH